MSIECGACDDEDAYYFFCERCLEEYQNMVADEALERAAQRLESMIVVGRAWTEEQAALARFVLADGAAAIRAMKGTKP